MFSNILRFALIALTVFSPATTAVVNGASTPATGLQCTTKPLAREYRDSIEHTIKEHRSNLTNAKLEIHSAVINVYFHVIAESNTYQGGMVPDSMIVDQMTILNNLYRSTGLTFRLAGIDRWISPTWYRGADHDTAKESQMKAKLHTGTRADLNIYTVGDIGGSHGYARFPMEAAGTILDGVVMLAGCLPGGTTPGWNGGKIAVHEVGHWTGLYHTFEVDNYRGFYYCETGRGDEVDDTPIQNGATSGCPIGRDSCPQFPGLDAIHNYMDYSDEYCLNNFTPEVILSPNMLSGIFRLTLLAVTLVHPFTVVHAASMATDIGPDRCGTKAPTGQYRVDIERDIQAHRSNLKINSTSAALATIDVYFHVIAQDNTRAGGNIPFVIWPRHNCNRKPLITKNILYSSDDMIQRQINVLNDDYRTSGLRFRLAGGERTINPTWYRKVYFGTQEAAAMTSALRKGDESTLNIYTVGYVQFYLYTAKVYLKGYCRHSTSGKPPLMKLDIGLAFTTLSKLMTSSTTDFIAKLEKGIMSMTPQSRMARLPGVTLDGTPAPKQVSIPSTITWTTLTMTAWTISLLVKSQDSDPP
ncbi:hypothetical protein CVT24_002430 [Panaeolus cyanescens]|uniref:Peptidase M43 pregnancy-associated plasma-A domain-containing protein n=1 Tax=Panaeolus cyanescens TaxID=181874 RepID=A0A409WK98_9AGAR|nr:hypothetical protein CVT24_002430 [Panaeolus cyanescens]